MSAVETLLVYWQDHRDQLRRSENQHAVLTNYILIDVAALSGFIVQPHFDPVTIPLPVLIIVVGRSGALTVAKYHERAEYHLTRAGALTQTLSPPAPRATTKRFLARREMATTGNTDGSGRCICTACGRAMHLAIAAYGGVLVVLSSLRAVREHPHWVDTALEDPEPWVTAVGLLRAEMPGVVYGVPAD